MPAMAEAGQMHEFSVITSIVELVKQEIDKRPVIIVKEINLEVGELTFLAEDALQFGFQALVEKEDKIPQDSLKITYVPAIVKCRDCGYEGPLRVEDSEQMHVAPVFACPKCHGQIDIIKGKECTIINLRMELEDS